MKHKKGKLYGIGVGPGDPELIPLKSVRILKGVDIVFAASSSKNDYSYAMEIARPHLSEDTTVIRLPCPMITDIEKKRQAWRKNAKIVIEYLNQGKNAAFITMGDPLTYSKKGLAGYCHQHHSRHYLLSGGGSSGKYSSNRRRGISFDFIWCKRWRSLKKFDW
jgi:precorrin-2/cobalt-factor-2 C20-methyltransferase